LKLQFFLRFLKPYFLPYLWPISPYFCPIFEWLRPILVFWKGPPWFRWTQT